MDELHRHWRLLTSGAGGNLRCFKSESIRVACLSRQEGSRCYNLLHAPPFTLSCTFSILSREDTQIPQTRCCFQKWLKNNPNKLSVSHCSISGLCQRQLCDRHKMQWMMAVYSLVSHSDFKSTTYITLQNIHSQPQWAKEHNTNLRDDPLYDFTQYRSPTGVCALAVSLLSHMRNVPMIVTARGYNIFLFIWPISESDYRSHRKNTECQGGRQWSPFPQSLALLDRVVTSTTSQSLGRHLFSYFPTKRICIPSTFT